MNQFKRMEVLVCSEDHTRSIGLVDEAEVWSNGSDLPGHLILRGFNAGRDDLLQAENECLRQDVEFYKNRVFEVERELEMDENEFNGLIIDYDCGVLSQHELAKRLKISLVKPEPTKADKIQEFINDWNKTPTFRSLAQHLADAGFTVPDKETVVDA